VDYGKFKFEAEKKAREAKKKQHVVEIKEIKCGIRIDQHDFLVKVNNAQRFLYEANKVKITIRLKGREVQHTNLAFDLANKFVLHLKDHGTLEGSLRLEGRNLTINLQPIKQAPKPLSLGEIPPHAQNEDPQIGS
jgi:translation initiation factor IF-3